MISSFIRKTGAFQLVVALIAIATVLSRAWVAEDAYITFRAVENLYMGNGLVFNTGERVEVFTHPLWMMILTLIRAMNFPLPMGALVVGLIFSLGAFFLLLERRLPDGRYAFPLAAAALMVHHGIRDFSTAGMEFSLVFFLLTVFYLDRSIHQLKDRPLVFSFILALLYLARPELALLYVLGSLFFLFEVFTSGNLETILRKIFSWMVPGLFVAGGYHLFRWMYYGELFPNTYYAKSGMGSYFIQGFKYLAFTTIWSPSLWIPLILFITFPFLVSWSGLKGRDKRYYLFDLLAAGGLTLYVTRVGGDFMAFRFLLPEITILALASDRLLQIAMTEKKNRFASFLNGPGGMKQPVLWYGAIAFFALFIFLPVPIQKGYIADERAYYIQMEEAGKTSPDDEPMWISRGRAFGELQGCLNYDPFWIANSQYGARCMQGVGLGKFGNAAGVRVLIQDEQGLPDRVVARSPIATRFRPGHEHYLTLRQVIDKGAMFCSTGESEYDAIMKTSAGILINLDPDLLSTVPHIHTRLEGLMQLKNQGSPAVAMLEKRWNVTIESLLADSVLWEQDPLQHGKNRCWDEFQGIENGFFY